MFHFSDRFSVEEWIEQNLEPLAIKLEELFNMKEVLTAQKNWPRRPIWKWVSGNRDLCRLISHKKKVSSWVQRTAIDRRLLFDYVTLKRVLLLRGTGLGGYCEILARPQKDIQTEKIPTAWRTYPRRLLRGYCSNFEVLHGKVPHPTLLWDISSWS